MKQQQGQTVSDALKIIGDVTTSQGQREAAVASIISAEATSDSWLTRTWRPLTMICFVVILLSFFLGYTPANLLSNTIPPLIGRIFDIVEIGLMGYIPARSLEKIVSSINVGSVLKAYISKKLL